MGHRSKAMFLPMNGMNSLIQVNLLKMRRRLLNNKKQYQKTQTKETATF